jgi:hypothetical protein
MLLTAALVLPSLWDVLASAAQTSGDIALIELRIREVVSAHPPLTGAYSRYGWDHPGPVFFWLAAVPYRLLGGGAAALDLVAVAVNTIGIMVLLRLAARLGRAPWYAIAGALVALVLGLSPDALASVWNVTITNVAVLLFVVACWGVWCSIDRAGWIALVAGSFVVQSHIGTGVVIGPLAVATTGLVVWRWWNRDGHPLDALAGPIALAGLLWVAPVGIDALTDPPGNLARLVRWSLTHDEPQIGFGTAARLLGRTSSLTFVVEPRLERGVFLDIETVELGVLPGLAIILLVASWFVAWRAGWRRELVWCSIVGSLWLSGLVAAASITLPLGWWLVQWLEPVGWMTWSAVALVAWRVAVDRRPALVRARAPVAVAMAALLTGTVVHAVDVVRSHERTTVQHATIRRLAEAVPSGVVDGPIAVVTEGDLLLADATLAGVVAALDRRGTDTCVEARLIDKFRAHRVCDAAAAPRLLLRLEPTAAPPPSDSTTLVVVDPLTNEQRAEIDRLTTELTDILGRDDRGDEIPLLGTPLADVILIGEPSPELAARAADVRRLAELRSIPGDRYALYQLPLTPR